MRGAPKDMSADADQQLLQAPEKFSFPFEPYGIQEQFMRTLYDTLEKGGIGIFESPTGTGKSLSVICGALRWLVDSEQRDREAVERTLSGGTAGSGAAGQAKEDGDGVPDWLRDYDSQRLQKEAQCRLKEEMERRARQREKLKKLRQEQKHISSKWKAKSKEDGGVEEMERAGEKGGDLDDEEEEVLVQEYHSEDEGAPEKESDTEEVEEEYVRKIYYCSRTHSQLAQFVKEVQKSPYGDTIQVVTLGSRQNLCINEDVKRLKHLTLINDRCLEMQRNKKKGREEKYSSDGRPREKRKKRRSNTTTTCPFLKQGTLENFRDLALAEVQDIEQLVGLGRQLGACPYYGVRHTIPSAQLVVLPYNTLLHAGTREALGLRLKGNIVIIDEAHNLLDVINSVHSVEISGAHVTKALSQLSQYKLRYKSRLKAKNLMYVNHILDILNCLLRAVSDSNKSEKGNKSATPEADVRLLRLNDFLFTSGLDNINLFKVLRYCKRSEIAKKLNGFVDRFFDHHLLPDLAQVGQGQVEGSGRSQGVAVASGDDKQMRSPLMIIESFLSALTSADKDGRIVVTKSARVTLSRLKFLLLNPAVHFSPILHECRAVVMTGGTMQPVSEFKDQLLYSVGVSPSRVIEFSCGHVIPADNLLPMALSRGPSGVTFDFTYQTRDTAALMDELGRAILNLCNVVPGGVVCFLPSYEYEKRLYTHWTTTGCLDKINSKKKVFREPKMASQVETVLTQYSRCIEFNRGCGGLSGALLLSVVGGKLSEGINFSDDLGRCVVMVGLPYPNIKSPELAEKMQYLNSTLPRDPDGKLPGQIHYENLCMKAVNQSIGRSIRHSRDYACIVLADQRYSRPSVRSKLPQWISSQLVACESFGPAFSSLRKFFIEKKKINFQS